MTRRTVLITGAAARVGRRIAVHLAAAGMEVWAHYNRSGAAAETLIAEIEAMGGAARAFPCNLGDDAALSAFIDRILSEAGPPDLLINNASLFERDPPAGLNPTLAAAHFQINAVAPMTLTDRLARAGDGGFAAVNILDSMIARRPRAFLSYTLSKSALAEATAAQARTLRKGARVNAVAPSYILRQPHEEPEDFARRSTANILRRAPGVEDILAAIDFIRAAPALNGEVLFVDGGDHLRTA